jgi:CSLREA domain-containing protein
LALAALFLIVFVAPAQAARAIVVNSVADTVMPGDGACTLREAMLNANADRDTTALDCAPGLGDDLILLVGEGPFSLEGQLPTVTSTMTISRQGSWDPVLQAGTAADTADYRPLQIDPGGDLTLDGVTVRYGRTTADGGGIYNAGTLTLIDATVGTNRARRGGGIMNAGGTVTLVNSVVVGNRATAAGGGIANDGELSLSGSTVRGNEAGRGGGLFNRGTATINASTLSGNRAHGAFVLSLGEDGGGLENWGAATLHNNTVSGNVAGGFGGGIHNRQSTAGLTLTHTTITDNEAAAGGGLANAFEATAELSGSLIAGNRATAETHELLRLSGTVTSGGHNLLGHGDERHDQAFAGFAPGPDDLDATKNGEKVPLDAILFPQLTDRDRSPTQTHALVLGSPAIDLAPTGPATDQRGALRPAGAGYDAGAFELTSTPPAGSIMITQTSTPGDNTRFRFTDTIAAPYAFALASPTQLSRRFDEVDAGGDYTVTALPEPGWTLAAIECFAGETAVSSDVATGTVTITGLAADDGVFCEFSHEAQPATLTVRHSTDPSGGPAAGVAIDPDPYRFAFQWGEFGSAQFDMSDDPLGVAMYVPTDIAIDAADNVYVADTETSRVRKFDSRGNLLTEWGSEGTGDGQFSGPLSISIDAAGRVNVTDLVAQRVQRFDSDGAYLSQGPLPDTPYGYGQFMATDATGNVYVAKPHWPVVQKYDSRGTLLAEWSAPDLLGGWVSMDIAVNAWGDVYIADAYPERILKFDREGDYLGEWGSYGHEPGQFDLPLALAVNSVGDVYVLDARNHTIQVFSPTLTATLDDGASARFEVTPGLHRVRPRLPDGRSVADITCDGGEPFVEGSAVWVYLDAGSEVTCAFTSEPASAPTHAPGRGGWAPPA